MVEFFMDFINARKDENMPIMMVLSYLPKVRCAREKVDPLKENFESFVSWAKLFKGVDVKSVSEGVEKELQVEYLKKHAKYYSSMLRRFTHEG